MQSVRARRRRAVDLRRVTLGDYIVLAASTLTLVSLFLPWFESSIGPSRSQWAFQYSEVASVVVILFFLITLVLVLYPALAPELGLPPIPFGAPLVLLVMGILLVLIFDYQLGKYACIQCQGTSRGFGVWIALISSFVYLVGTLIKWNERQMRR